MSSKLLDLVIDTESPLDEAEIARRVERACDLVEAFTDEAALPTLEDLLTLADGQDLAESALHLQDVAASVSRRAELLESEVLRFLAAAGK